MDQIADQKRKAAISALIRIAILEGVVLMLVIASYLMTGALWVLFVGIAGSMAIFAPMFISWAKEHGTTMKTKPNSIEESQG